MIIWVICDMLRFRWDKEKGIYIFIRSLLVDREVFFISSYKVSVLCWIIDFDIFVVDFGFGFVDVVVFGL